MGQPVSKVNDLKLTMKHHLETAMSGFETRRHTHITNHPTSWATEKKLGSIYDSKKRTTKIFKKPREERKINISDDHLPQGTFL